MFEKKHDFLLRRPIDVKLKCSQRRHSWDTSSETWPKYISAQKKKSLLRYASNFHIKLLDVDLSCYNFKANDSAIKELSFLNSGISNASTSVNNRQACANFYKLIESPLSWGDKLNECISIYNPHNFLQQHNFKYQQCMNQQQKVISPTNIACHRNSLLKMSLKNSPEIYLFKNGQESECQQNLTGLTNVSTHIFGWQVAKSTIKERMIYMCLNEHLADVFFIFDGVGNNRDESTQSQKIPAHKFVLSIGSPVFDAMFNKYGDNYNAIQEIHLIDIEFKAFVALLTFLYTDEVKILPDSVLATLYAAKKYAVSALEILCVNFLKENLNAENAFMLLAQARLFDEQHLSELCLNIIDRETSEALQAESFLDIDHETLCAVLKRDALRISELALFQAILKWTDETCIRKNLPITSESRRQVLGKAINLVRFSQMTSSEFSENVALTNLLTDTEKVEIFLHFCLPQGSSIQRAHFNGPLKFPVGSRMRFIGKEISVNRFQRIEASWGYSGTPDRIKFTVDAPIYILGFGLYGSVNESCSYNVFMEIINFGSNHILAKHETTFLSDGTPNIFTVMFPEPVEICSGLTYIASARLRGAETHYGTKGLRRIVRQSSSSKYAPSDAITFQFSYAAGNNNGTSVDDGQIPEIIFCEKFL